MAHALVDSVHSGYIEAMAEQKFGFEPCPRAGHANESAQDPGCEVSELSAERVAVQFPELCDCVVCLRCFEDSLHILYDTHVCP